MMLLLMLTDRPSYLTYKGSADWDDGPDEVSGARASSGVKRSQSTKTKITGRFQEFQQTLRSSFP